MSEKQKRQESANEGEVSGKEKSFGWESQTSDTWCTIHICSLHFAFTQQQSILIAILIEAGSV